MNDIALLPNASVVIALDGRIHAVDTETNLLQQPWYTQSQYETDVNCEGQCILPGLVDAHTHPVFDGDRVHEYELKLQGATYMEIHKQGGGIGFTVEHTRKASTDRLTRLLLARLDRMLRQGTTLIEAKSGYGLEVDTEMRMLQVLSSSPAQGHPITISPTFLGAHSVPKGMTAQQATSDILDNQLPRLKQLMAEGSVHCDNIDVFYEKGVFEREETRQILVAGKAMGLNLNFHGDELHPMGAGELGAELGALAISHLEEISPEGIRAMADHSIFGVLLPTTAYVLRIKPPPARALIDGGVPVALGSDFNPNAHCMSMPFVMNLACTMMRLTLNEALVAATLNAAASMNKSGDFGSIEVGKFGNVLVLDHSDWRHLIYEMVDPPLASVFVKGSEVYRRYEELK